jgi:nucleotide-binding universal stress UspA family protein
VVPLNSTGWTAPAAIVIGHDGSENAKAALEPAVMLARALETELTLVRAVTPVTGLGGAARYYNTGDEIAETDLKQLQSELAGTGLTVTTFVGKRPPEQELLGVAGSRMGSVIAVSTSSLSAEPNVLGSTTDRLVRSQTHPVLAVPSR